MTEQQGAQNAELSGLVESQKALIAALEARIADLEARLGRNPRNSSMPPSKEGLGKPNRLARPERRAAGRRQGKQPGAPGQTSSRSSWSTGLWIL